MSMRFSEELITKPGMLEGHVDPPGAKAPLERFLPGVLAYAEGYSFGGGDEVAVKVSSTEPALQAEIVRLRAPLSGRAARDACETVADLGRVDGLAQQPLTFGSHLVVAAHDRLDPEGGALFAGWIRPTLVELPGVQTLFALTDAADRVLLRLDLLAGGTLECRMGDAVARLEHVLMNHRWQRVVAGWSPSRGQLELHWRSDAEDDGPARHAAVAAVAPMQHGPAGIVLGAAPDPAGPWTTDNFNGKLARLRWHADLDADALQRLADAAPDAADGAQLLAAWDLAAVCAHTEVVDRGPLALLTTIVNGGQRGVTGPSWSGAPQTSFADADQDYDAVALHDDDVADLGWKTTLAWRVPDELPSGVYAVRLSSPTSERFVPFVVRPDFARALASTLLVVLPWYTYLLYANDQICRRGHGDRDTAYRADPVRRYLREHPSLGYSAYDRHRDGTGIAYSSARRPILNLSPDYVEVDLGAPRHFAADLFLIEFLEATGRPYEVVTDAEVDRLGLAALAPYRCLLTGSHPEYMTARMLDAFDAYLARGGNIMYLGGNGFYHPVSVAPDGLTVERRYDGGTVWQSEPGEFHHSLDGQVGRHWADLGRSSQRLVGVTATGEGTGGLALGYRRVDDLPPETSFVFAGVTSQLVGAHGAARGGAAGDELDGIVAEDPQPERSVLLARAEGFDPYYVGLRSSLRADMVLVLHPEGGRAFSVGSISWSAALADDGFDNDVAHVTANVIDEFTAPGQAVRR